MTTVLLIIQVLVAIALTGVILLQRSEGGALGVGGSPGGMMSGRGAANALTRTTMILGAVFIANCIAMAVLAGGSPTSNSVTDIVEEAPLSVPVEEETPAGVPTDG